MTRLERSHVVSTVIGQRREKEPSPSEICLFLLLLLCPVGVVVSVTLTSGISRLLENTFLEKPVITSNKCDCQFNREFYMLSLKIPF